MDFPACLSYLLPGFFRVQYDEENWKLIANYMMKNPEMFSKITRAQLIDDALAMFRHGLLLDAALEVPLALLHQGLLGELTAGDVGMFERAMMALADLQDCLRGTVEENALLVSDEALFLGLKMAYVN